MSHEQTKPRLPQWAFYAGVVVVLVSLLIISRWMFLAAHSLFLVYLYQRSKNRGLLIAGAIMMGLSIGLLVERLIDSPERVTSAGGVGLALIGLYVFNRQISDGPSWLWPVVGLAFLAVMAFLWTASESTLEMYGKAYPVGLVSLFLVAGVQWWRDRQARAKAKETTQTQT